MSKKRFDNLDPERQQRLYESAAAEFAVHGFDAASLNRIIADAGMSKSSMYYYFEDKADLFTTVLERSVALLFREIGGFDPDKLTAETYWSELEALFRRSVDVMNHNAWYVQLGRMFYRMVGNKSGQTPAGRMTQLAHRWLGVLIERGQALGVVRADLPISLLIDAAFGLGEAIDRWVVAHWDDFDEQQRVELASRQVDLFRRILS